MVTPVNFISLRGFRYIWGMPSQRSYFGRPEFVGNTIYMIAVNFNVKHALDMSVFIISPDFKLFSTLSLKFCLTSHKLT